MRSLIWFRRDLRISDNRALNAAAQSANEGVVAVFLLTPRQWLEHHDSAIKIHFWLANLRALSTSLEQLRIPLIVRSTDNFDSVPETLLSIARETKCNRLFFNREYEVNERRRDREVGRKFRSRGLETQSFDDRAMIPPEKIQTQEGRFYSVFSPYQRAWLRLAEGLDWDVLAAPGKQPEIEVKSSPIPKSVPGFELPPDRLGDWPPGEQEALRRLEEFTSACIEAYGAERDFPGIDGTSRLSPYLAAGVLSPRQCLAAARTANRGDFQSERDGPSAWISELIWRDFYTHVLVGFPRVSKDQPFQEKTAAIAWRVDESDCQAWKAGRTGVPIVDAAMRQLNQTGWMHNRLRMITAMFFSKQLFLDWRIGERYFMENLIDGDLAANNGGWQWSASTGTDAAPYFRIFNPYRQSERFDPQGTFIKQYCPELKELDGKAIHDPSRLDRSARTKLDYPDPIVEHAAARKRAIDAFKALK